MAPLEHLRLLLRTIHLSAHLRFTLCVCARARARVCVCVRARARVRVRVMRRELRAGASLVHPPTPIGVMSMHYKGGPEDDAVAMSFAPAGPWVTPAMSRALWYLLR